MLIHIFETTYDKISEKFLILASFCEITSLHINFFFIVFSKNFV